MFVQVYESICEIFGGFVHLLVVIPQVRRVARRAGRVAEPFGVWPDAAGLLAEPLKSPNFFEIALVQTWASQ